MTLIRPLLRRFNPLVFNDGLSRLNRLALSVVEQRPGSSFLDVGCGAGSFTLEFAKKLKADAVYGVEIIQEFAAAATEKGIKCKSSNLEHHWEFEDNTFDFVLSSQNIEHIANTRKYVEEAFRVLKPGGQLMVLTENLASWVNVFALLWGWQPFSTTNICGWSLGNPWIWHVDQGQNSVLTGRNREISEAAGHIRVLTYCGLQHVLRQVGFTHVTMASRGWFPLIGSISDLMCRVDPRHGHFLLAKAIKPIA